MSLRPLGPGLAVVFATLLLAACASPRAEPSAPAPSVPTVAATAVPSVESGARLPPWAPAGADNLRLPTASHIVPALEGTPRVVITRERVLVDGEVIALVADISRSQRLTKIEPLFNHFRALADAQRAEEGAAFSGRVDFWVHEDAPVLVIKSAFQTVAFAGYPNAGFVVRQTDSDTIGVVLAAARIPNAAGTPRVRLGAQSVSGKLPPELIQRTIRRNFKALRTCYEDGLSRNSQLEGKVRLGFAIQRDGSVSNVRIISSTLPDELVTACLAATFEQLRFPQPEGGIVTVVYPMAFAPK